MGFQCDYTVLLIIAPPTIQALQALRGEMEHVRAVEQDSAFSQLVLQWPTLPEHVRLTIGLLIQNSSNGGES